MTELTAWRMFFIWLGGLITGIGIGGQVEAYLRRADARRKEGGSNG